MAKQGNKLEADQPPFVLLEPKTDIKTVGRERPPRFTREQFAEKRIIHPGMKDIDVLNAFRDLRTSILPRLGSFNSVLQVSALGHSIGASFNALNLAVSCTFDQHRHALLVDCNFEKPSLARTLDITADVGLYDFLTDRIESVADIVFPTAIPRLSLVPSGIVDSEDHIEFFTGENMRHFLHDVRNRYDDRIIIIDAPPILESADAKILCEITDYVLLVLPHKGASSSKINKMIKTAGKDKVVGFVVNN